MLFCEGCVGGSGARAAVCRLVQLWCSQLVGPVWVWVPLLAQCVVWVLGTYHNQITAVQQLTRPCRSRRGSEHIVLVNFPSTGVSFLTPCRAVIKQGMDSEQLGVFTQIRAAPQPCVIFKLRTFVWNKPDILSERLNYLLKQFFVIFCLQYLFVFLSVWAALRLVFAGY